MEYQSPHRAPKKKNRAPLVIIIVVVVLAAVAAAVVLAGRISSPGGRAASDAYFADGPTAALLVEPPPQMGGDSLRAYFGEAAAYARANGLNTLVFEGRRGLTVLWEDDEFPLTQDANAAGIDPLGILCEVASGQELEVWVSLDPYAGGGHTSEMKGGAVELSKKLGDPTAFDPADESYRKLAAQSLAGLAKHYPVAGVVLTGLDSAAEDEGFASLLTDAKNGMGESRLVLDAGAAEAFTPELCTRLLSDGRADRVLFAPAEGAGIAEHLAACGGAPGGLMLDERAGDASGAALFTAAQDDAFGGALYAAWPEAGADAARIGFLKSALSDAQGELPAGFDIPQTLQINYPLEADAIGADQETVFVMGNSDPALPLLLDGEEIQRISSNGSFGAAVSLAPGDNTFVFSQGEATVSHTVTRPEPAAGGTGDGGGTPAEVPNDTTKEAEPGQAVQVTGVFTGALSDPNDDSAINETYYGGAVAVVQDNYETWRYDADAGRTVKTWAYQLTGGEWITARNCAWIDGDGKSAFTGLAAETEARGEWITFEGTGTPAATISCKDGVLAVTMYDTSFTLPDGFSSAYVKSARVEEVADGVRLELQVEGIWGYQIDYTEGTRLFLKSPPALSGNDAAPLEGVRVMIDPGHGDRDIGAPGIMGSAAGPNEKDVNLAQAQAIAYRLRQLGAEVTMIRDGEVYLTTHERLALEIEEKPDFFLSVHHNSAELNADRNTATGMQVYYHMPKGYTAPLSHAYAQNLMDGMAVSTGRKASDAAYGYFNVTRTPVCPDRKSVV